MAIQAKTSWKRFPAVTSSRHRGERHAQPAGELALPGLAIEIGPGIADDDPTDESHQKQHRGADRIRFDRQADADQPEDGTDAGAQTDQLDH